MQLEKESRVQLAAAAGLREAERELRDVGLWADEREDANANSAPSEWAVFARGRAAARDRVRLAARVRLERGCWLRMRTEKSIR